MDSHWSGSSDLVPSVWRKNFLDEINGISESSHLADKPSCQGKRQVESELTPLSYCASRPTSLRRLVSLWKPSSLEEVAMAVKLGDWMNEWISFKIGYFFCQYYQTRDPGIWNLWIPKSQDWDLGPGLPSLLLYKSNYKQSTI